MASILNFWGSPSKASSKESVNGTSPKPRGTKRKAKRDPYDDMDMDDEDDIIPARKTPASQRTAPSRLSSGSGSVSAPATPGSSGKPRLSITAKRRPGRPSLKSQKADASDAAPTPRTAKSHGPPPAKTADAATTPLDSLVPEAPMGGLELPRQAAVVAPASSVPKPEAETVQQPPTGDEGKEKEKGKGNENATISVDQDEDPREEHEIDRLLEHRMARDRVGAVDLLVQWADEGEQDATWEAEEEIQQNAAEILYDYWKAQGGRINALFHKPKNAPPETYHVFKVLRHEKKERGGFHFEVQWVGHPPTHGETTMEAEVKLKNIAPELLQEYWDGVGGRAKYLAPRGRAKKSRVE